tara:strand:+ start:794 stop:1450 length:657 start_codon:yes stop_codon:yes gene_type:complete
MSSAGNGKKKTGKLKGYKCFTRVNKSGATYTTCRDDEQQLRIASAKKKRELTKPKQKRLTKEPAPPKPKKPKKPKASPKEKKPRGRPKTLPPKVKPPPKKLGRKAGGKNKPKPTGEDEDGDVEVSQLVLSTNLNGYKFKYNDDAFNNEIYFNSANGEILDPETGDKVGRKIKTMKGVLVPKEGYYKITNKKWLARHMPNKDLNTGSKTMNVFRGKVLN